MQYEFHIDKHATCEILRLTISLKFSIRYDSVSSHPASFAEKSCVHTLHIVGSSWNRQCLRYLMIFILWAFYLLNNWWQVLWYTRTRRVFSLSTVCVRWCRTSNASIRRCWCVCLYFKSYTRNLARHRSGQNAFGYESIVTTCNIDVNRFFTSFYLIVPASYGTYGPQPCCVHTLHMPAPSTRMEVRQNHIFLSLLLHKIHTKQTSVDGPSRRHGISMNIRFLHTRPLARYLFES